jgi:hypothetical protein
MRAIRLISSCVMIAATGACAKDRAPTEYSAVVQVIVEPITVAVEKGRTVTLRARVIGPGAVSQRVLWSSSADSIASVTSAGIVTGITDGSARIRAAWAEDTEIYKEADVSVTLRIEEEPNPLLPAPVVRDGVRRPANRR